MHVCVMKTIMSSKGFNVILPSNSNPTIFPNNLPAEYSVEFTNPIILNGPHALALSEITYYNDISLLKNNFFELYSEKVHKDDCFRICHNETEGTWEFYKVPLTPFVESSPGILNLKKIESDYKKGSLQSIVPTLSVEETEKEISKTFYILNKLFIVRLDKYYKAQIVPSEEIKEKRKHILLVISKDLAHTMGYQRNTISSVYPFSGTGWKFSKKISDWKAIVLPLYALKKQTYIIKSRNVSYSTMEDVAKQISLSVPKDLLSCKYNETEKLLVIRKLTKCTTFDSCAIEFDQEFLKIFKNFTSPPCLTTMNDELILKVSKKRLKSSVHDIWSLYVYKNEIDDSRLDRSTKLLKRVNLHVESLKTPSEICSKLNEYAQAYLDDEYEFMYDPIKKRMDVKVPKGHQMKLDNVLATILGFSKNDFLKPGTTSGDMTPILERDINNLYIYCSIVDYTRVGNIEAPLIRTLPLSSVRKQLINREFVNKMFVSINRNVINRIDISVRDDMGEIVPFHGGITVLTVEIRPLNE